MKPLVIHVRNVNHALPLAVMYLKDETWARSIGSRVAPTLEIRGPVMTCYDNPLERVLFEPKRDANPFFHLFESLWILAGRRDVKWLKFFLNNISDYSDNGEVFHGAYGARIQSPSVNNNKSVSQFVSVIEELSKSPDSRRAVVALWIPERDQGYSGKDMPCNTTLYFKIRDGALNLTVCNRSNDMLWGAYGANVVQFSFILEYLAAMLGVPIGSYVQISDSFHVYPETECWRKCKDLPLNVQDPYSDEFATANYVDPEAIHLVRPFPLVQNSGTFDRGLMEFMSEVTEAQESGGFLQCSAPTDTFFWRVATPMYNTLRSIRNKDNRTTLEWVSRISATDWQLAAKLWVDRRMKRAGSFDAHMDHLS